MIIKISIRTVYWMIIYQIVFALVFLGLLISDELK
ncbi:MAG: hypothetical protein IJ195_02450 [Lachnospiraceae bacterium]|nr:hypothetical protein [Lachnospiraceae bacterium]MBQ8138297.1 hypothetical protein [Lachnospiraceae bacterium]MBR1651292.1 hypothetical protein [Lachnospiraceae bacterium]